MNYLRRLNDALPGLVLGILLYGGILEIPVLLFAPDRWNWSIGLWYGTAIAVGMAVNMASVIYDTTITRDSAAAQKMAILKSVLRYLVAGALLFLLGFLKFGNLYMSLVGVFGLKVSAYMQPLMGMISRKLVGDNWMYPEDRMEPVIDEELQAGEGVSEETISEEQ